MVQNSGCTCTSSVYIVSLSHLLRTYCFGFAGLNQHFDQKSFIYQVPKVAMVFTIKVALSDVTTLSFNAITGECKATLTLEEPQKMLFRDVRKDAWIC